MYFIFLELFDFIFTCDIILIYYVVKRKKIRSWHTEDYNK